MVCVCVHVSLLLHIINPVITSSLYPLLYHLDLHCHSAHFTMFIFSYAWIYYDVKNKIGQISLQYGVHVNPFFLPSVICIRAQVSCIGINKVNSQVDIEFSDVYVSGIIFLFFKLVLYVLILSTLFCYVHVNHFLSFCLLHLVRPFCLFDWCDYLNSVYSMAVVM